MQKYVVTTMFPANHFCGSEEGDAALRSQFLDSVKQLENRRGLIVSLEDMFYEALCTAAIHDCKVTVAVVQPGEPQFIFFAGISEENALGVISELHDEAGAALTGLNQAEQHH